jgi:putative transposase
MFIDGKVLQNQNMVVAIGIIEQGDKRNLGITQSTTENSVAIDVMLSDMVGRGLDFEQGLLIVIDGGTGLRKAIDEVFGIYGAVQRCYVHKLRNVLSHLSDNERQEWQRILKISSPVKTSMKPPREQRKHTLVV